MATGGAAHDDRRDRVLRLDAAWGSPRLADSATGLAAGSGGDGLVAFRAAGGYDGIPSLAGGDDSVQLP
jgi:hypothetical protein